MKTAKKAILLLLSLLLLTAGTLLFLAFAYEDEVKDYMIAELNRHLKTPVLVNSKDIDFTFLKNFPYASLDFKNVRMLEAASGKKQSARDTLLAMEKISFRFSLLDVLQKKYAVKKIEAENGTVKLKTAADGSDNWEVWKETGDTSSSSAFRLEKLQFSRVELSYTNAKNKSFFSALVRDGKAGGEFSSRQYELSVDGDLQVHQLKSDSLSYLADKPVKLDLSLKADRDKRQYEFSRASLSISDLDVSVEGTYTDSSPSRYVDLTLKGKDMDISSILSLLPEKYSAYMKDYNSEGDFYCNARLQGAWTDAVYPELTADFGIAGGEITQISSGIFLRNIRLEGNYILSPAKSLLEVKTLTAALGNGKISGSLNVTREKQNRASGRNEFSPPFLRTKVNADFPLEEFRHFLKIDTLWTYPIEALHGNIRLNLEYAGQLHRSDKYTRADFDAMNLAGDASLDNAGMKIKNSALAFDSINGSFVLNDNDIEINSFSGRTARSDFSLKGYLKNILAYSFTGDADLDIEAAFQSGNFDLDEFLINQKETSRRDTAYRVQFSPRINFTLSSDIRRLAFRRFAATQVKGTFRLRDRKLIADPLSFSTMDGSVTASGMVDNTQADALLITCNASLSKLSIAKLFDEFEDFGQNTLTHRHLKGTGTADVQFASVWSSALVADLNRIYVRSNTTIENGELMRFEPMKALSKYISLSELEDIKFSTLQNQIEIKNQKIFIPKMDIRSSALDVTLAGSHSFANDLDYHFKVLMSDILFKKAKKAKKENDEFGVVEDDKSGKTSLFLSMTGTMDHPVIKYDKQGAKQNLKENLAEEKHTLRQILKDEFGWFKKDSTLNKKEKPKEDGKFIIQWDEDKKEKGKKEEDDF